MMSCTESGSSRAGWARKVGRIDGFDLVGEIGTGGMAVVFEAIRHRDRRVVALKVLQSSAHRVMLTRFEQEARLGLTIRHPNIVRTLEAKTSGAAPWWIAMERLEGTTFDAAIEDERFDTRARIEAVIQAARALHHLHERGIIHRDVKPTNLFRTKDGRTKLLDFGVAKVGSQVLTDPGCVPGSAKYVAPEQVLGGGIDRRADVFALGTVLYELLSGGLPWTHENTIAQMWAKCTHEPKPIFTQWMYGNRHAPPLASRRALSEIVHRAIRTDRESRFGGMDELAAALTKVLAMMDEDRRR